MDDSIRHGQITLFSETDRYGTITFVNDAFCEISKYSREELIGMPHNIIRHPDMPKKLFAIMWSTLQAAKVFSGIIKNRAKDNSYYWVQASIMPVPNRDINLIRYIGVRHLMDDQEAEELYALQEKKFEL